MRLSLRLVAAVLLGLLALAMPAGAQQVITLAPTTISGITATTVTVNTATIPPGAKQLDILWNITAGGTATGTLQIWLEDSVDNGNTWDDLCSTLTFSLGAAAARQRFFVSSDIVSQTITTAAPTVTTQGSANQVEAMAAGSCRQGPMGDRIRVREKITGPAGSPVGATYTITAVAR
jgi:hypothetical protein